MKKNHQSISRILIANRGEIACRIIQACEEMEITPVLAFSAGDRNSRACRLAKEKICLGPTDARESYLSIERVIAAAQATDADAIHPGYGFLAENPEFARACEKNNIILIGPSSDAMRRLGDKIEAKKLAKRCKISLLEHTTCTTTDLTNEKKSSAVFALLKKKPFPLLVKAAAGGGGRGMRIIESARTLESEIRSASHEAEALFKDGTVFIEPYIRGARHVEVQVIADEQGNTRALGTRDCSLQRRHQKIVEEAPASWLSKQLEDTLLNSSAKLVKAARYCNLATVEFLITPKGKFYFLEVNTRLQVEHTVTELSLGLDLVKAQVRIARGERLSSILETGHQPAKHAIEARLCAEIPSQDFCASTGRLSLCEYPSLPGTRVDYGFDTGDIVSHNYDSLIAKIITVGNCRPDALQRMQLALAHVATFPLETNLGYLRSLITAPAFTEDRHSLQSADENLVIYRERCQALLPYALSFAAFPPLHGGISSPWLSSGNWSFIGRFENKSNHRYQNRRFELFSSRTGDKATIQIYENGTIIFKDTLSITGPVHEPIQTFLFSDRSTTANVRISDRGDAVVTIDGIPFLIEIAAPLKTAKSTKKLSSPTCEITAPLPGKIVQLKVKIGDIIDEGTVLFVLESMKMEHPVIAQQSGIVESITCASGDSTQAGDIVLTIRGK